MPNPRFVILLLGTMALLTFECCRRLNAAPPVATTRDSTLATPMSHYAFAVRYELDEFEEWLNEKVSGRFLTQGFRVRDGKDSLYLELTRNAPISLEIRRGKLHLVVPLHVEGRYFRRVAGINLRHKHPIATDIRLVLSTAVAIDRDWRLVSEVELQEVEWITEPQIQLGPLRFNLKKVVTRMIRQREDQFEDMFDEQIHAHVSLEKTVQRLWLQLQKPLPVYKKEPRAWFKSRCESIAGQLVLQGSDQLVFQVLIDAQSAIGLDTNALPITNRELPALLPYPAGHPPGLELVVHTALPFAVANEQLNNFLAGQEVSAKGYHLRIKQARLYGTDHGIAVQLKVRGDVWGDLYLVGQPVYAPAETTLRIDSFRYDVNTQNLLATLADQLYRDKLMQYLQPHLEVQVGAYLDSLPGLIMGAVERGKIGRTIDLQIDTLRVWHYESLATTSDIQLVLYAQAAANIELQRLKPGKKLRVR